MLYEFKWAKRQEVLSQMPKYLQLRVEAYFNRVLAGNIPHFLFDDKDITRCSTFRVKGLKHGAQVEMSQKLVETGLVMEFSLEDANSLTINENLRNLPQLVQETYEEYAAKGYNNYKPSHDDVLSRILLKDLGALSIETPVWVQKQSNLDLYLKKGTAEELLSFTFRRSITGHIDLLLYDPADQSLVIADYKPEGHFLRSLPQIASYGLMLKRIMQLDQVKCISFRKEDAWIYDPEIIRTHIEKFLVEYGNPELSWRSLL
ncbi:MAG: hypothetical protein KAR20_27625, partial [Candidatus Heimdallarchaeota archaeon]|nr:hypothetical protein [Candidatus Heimdallarchaeota archaeon]